jgi:anti-sigma B factor antagonist
LVISQRWALSAIDDHLCDEHNLGTRMATSQKVVPLEGEIDLHVSPRMAATLNAALKEKPRHLVIDMSKCSYIDSSGLAVLIEAMQNVEKYGGKFALTALQDSVKPIFEIARLDQVFRIFPDVDAALGPD